MTDQNTTAIDGAPASKEQLREQFKREFLSEWGRKGGSSTSDKKKKAAKKNIAKAARINRQLARKKKA